MVIGLAPEERSPDERLRPGHLSLSQLPVVVHGVGDGDGAAPDGAGAANPAAHDAVLWLTGLPGDPPDAAARPGPGGGVDGHDGDSGDAVRAGADRGVALAWVCVYDWPCEEALRVVECESGFNPGAVDETAENFGLFQINEYGDGVQDGKGFDGWRPYFGEERWAQVLDGAANAAMAYEIYVRGGGWFPWTCKP